MLLNKFKLSRFKNPRRHILILDALIGQNRGRQIPLQIHMAQPLHIEGCDGVVAVPKGLQGRPRHGAQRGQQPPRLGQKLRQALRRKAVGIHVHLFGGRNDDPHGCLLSERLNKNHSDHTTYRAV